MTKRKIRRTCPDCWGSGKDGAGRRCATCSGTGDIEQEIQEVGG